METQEKKETKKKKINIFYILALIILIFSIFCIFIYITLISFFTKTIYNFDNNIKKELFIAIDFGNHESRYAYNFGRNNKIIQGQMRKIPSVIILNKKNLDGKNYGIKSINSISNYGEEEMNSIIYKDNLKLMLYNMSNNINNTISNSSAFIEVSQTIIEYLKLFTDDIIKEVNSNGANYLKQEINWIITVPRTWNDYEKMNLINFAKKAGLNHIELALESEVAAISVLEDKIIKKEFKTNGKKFLLIDLGDYKIDISFNEIINNNVKQLMEPIGGNFGSMNINKDLIEVVDQIFGEKTITNAKEKQFDEYLQTLKGLEDVKKNIKKNTTDNFEVYAKFERITSLIDNIIDFFPKLFAFITRKKFVKEIKYKNYTVKIDEYKIYIPGKLVEEIIQKRVDEIINFMKSNKINMKDYNYVVLTGGFSNCEILVHDLRKYFKNVIILSNQENSVLQGALIYLNNKQKIYSIVSYNAYGIGEYIKNNGINNNKKGEDINKLIERDDIIRFDNYLNLIVDTNSIQSDFMCFNFYKSPNKNISKEDYFGTLEINLSQYKNINSSQFSFNLVIRFIPYFRIDVFDSKTYKKIEYSFSKKLYSS